jgi:hypothetical protein
MVNHTLGTRTVTLDYVLGEGGGGRAGFRHVPHVPRHRAPTKWGAPKNEGPHAKADSNKKSSRHKGFNALGAGPLERGPP